jgi:hypothetical protein
MIFVACDKIVILHVPQCPVKTLNLWLICEDCEDCEDTQSLANSGIIRDIAGLDGTGAVGFLMVLVFTLSLACSFYFLLFYTIFGVIYFRLTAYFRNCYNF